MLSPDLPPRQFPIDLPVSFKARRFIARFWSPESWMALPPEDRPATVLVDFADPDLGSECVSPARHDPATLEYFPPVHKPLDPRVQQLPNGWRVQWLRTGMDAERAFQVGLLSREQADALLAGQSS